MNRNIAKKAVVLFTSILLCSIAFASGKKDAPAKEDKIPQRIVSLSPAGSEILCEIGAYDQIVARTDFCDYPATMSEKPSVGGFDGKTLSIETILSYEPDFVYGAKGMHDFLKEPLENAGIELYLSDATSISAIEEEIKYIAKRTGHEEEGNNLVQTMAGSIESLKKEAEYEGPVTIYYEVWNAPFMSVGSKSFINSIVEIFGDKNIFDDIEDEYPMISEEAILARNPQVILIPDMNGETIENVANRNGWQDLDAVKNKNIYFVDSNIFSRPGPRIIDAIKELVKILNESQR